MSYPIPGFSQPLKREVNVYDPREVDRFIKRLNESPKRKRDLERLYTLSNNVHSHRICAPDPESLQEILRELEEAGLIYRETDE